MDLKDLSALELSTAIKKGEAGVEEAVKVSLEQIKKSEDTVHAFLETDEEKVYQRVKEVEAGIASGKYSGPLAGVPIAVKDNICTKGRKTTCASKILGNFVPPYDAEAVKKLEEAGMIILGKTNMDEFAMGSTSETSAFGLLIMERQRIRGIWSMYRVDLPVVHVPQWPQERLSWHLVRIPVVRFVSHLLTVAWSE